MRILTRISLVFALFVIVSCSSPDEVIVPAENSLVGNWKLVNITMSKYPDAPDHAKDIGTVLSLKNNDVFTLYFNEKVILGKWFIEEGYFRLYYKDELLLNYDEYKLTEDQLKMTYYWTNEEKKTGLHLL